MAEPTGLPFKYRITVTNPGTDFDKNYFDCVPLPPGLNGRLAFLPGRPARPGRPASPEGPGAPTAVARRCDPSHAGQDHPAATTPHHRQAGDAPAEGDPSGPRQAEQRAGPRHLAQASPGT